MKILLLALGFPVWFSLYVAFCAVLLSACAAIWSVFVSLAAVAIAGIVLGAFYIYLGNILLGVALLGAAFVGAGLSVFLFIASVYTTKGSASLMKNVTLGIFKRGY